MPPVGRRQGGGAWLTPPRNRVEAELDQALNEAAAADTDEVALRRVWSRVAQIPELVAPHADIQPPRRARWPWIAAASLAGAAAAVAFMLLGTEPMHRARTVLLPPSPPTSTPTRDEAERSTLVAPATVRTGKGEVLHLALKGGTEITVTSSSTLVLDEDERPAVSSGEVQFHVPPQPMGRTFSVSASGFRVVVVGTRFRVRVAGVDAAVGVDEGIVEVWKNDSRLARLTPGESWASAPAEPKAIPAETEKQAEKRGDSTSARAETTPFKRVVGSQRQAQVTRGLIASVSPRTSSLSSASDGYGALMAPNFDTASPFTTAPERPRTGGPTRNAPGSTPAPPAGQAASPPPSADTVTLVAQARVARAAGEGRKALAIYRIVAQRGGTAGENAEYEIGRVLRDNLHQPREAIAAWRSYRSQHPRGLLRIESDISLIETLVVVNDKVEALSETLDFVRRFPDSERRAEMGGLAGDLLRERGDFKSAVSEYDGALESGRGRKEFTDAISFHRSVCVLHEDRDLGVLALRAYLQAFSVGHFRSQAERLLDDQTRTLQAQRP